MKLRNLARSVAVVTAILCAPHANAQNVELATNLSFEDPIGAVGGVATDEWNPFVGPGAVGAGTGTDAPLDGATHAEITIVGTDASFAGIQYEIAGITAGEDYTFSFSARSEGVNLGGVDGEFRFEFLDAGGAIIGDQFSNNEAVVATDTYAPFTQTRTAPTAATSLRAVIAIQSFGAGLDDSNTGTLFIDSASIQGPPIGTPVDPPVEPPVTPGPVMELVSNPSFEDPIGALDEVTSGQWNPFSNQGATFAGTDTTAPLTGSTHGVASISGDDNSFAGFQQQVDNIIPGEDYTFSLNARSEGVNLGGIDAEFRIEYLDANGGFTVDQFTNNIPIVATDTYASFTQTNTAPAGTVSLRAVIAVQSFGGGVDPTNTGALFIDDTSIMGSLPESDVLKGDVDLSGVVDFADIPAFIAILQEGIFQAEADADCNKVINFSDIPAFIEILQGS